MILDSKLGTQKILFLEKMEDSESWINAGFVSVLAWIKGHIVRWWAASTEGVCVCQCSATNGSQETVFGFQY